MHFKNTLKFKLSQDLLNRMTDINSIYQERATQFATIAKDLKEKYNRFSIIRLLVFFAAAFVAVFIFAKFNAFAGIVFLLLALFGFS